MDREFKIPDIIVRDLEPGDRFLTILHEEDHLLRRFGQVDFVRLDPQDSLGLCREQADEIWAVVSGEASFTLTDKREESPGLEEQIELSLRGSRPQALLVPFGVQCRIYSENGASCVRLTTHHDGAEPDDKIPG